MSKFSKQIEFKDFVKVTLILISITLLNGCWVFTGEAPVKKNEITGNSLPESESEITQEIISLPDYQFSSPMFQDQPISKSEVINTRRQYFGDIFIEIKNAKTSPYTKLVYWENYVNNSLFSRGKGGWVEASTSIDGLNSTAIFKNIKLQNQVKNKVKFFFDNSTKKILIGEITLFADFEYPEIIINQPRFVEFKNQIATSTLWFEDSSVVLGGLATDNISLKEFGYRIIDPLSDVESVFSAISLNGSRWSKSFSLDDGEKNIEFLAEDIFGNKTYRRIKVGLDNEGPQLLFENSSGVREAININQGSQEWSITERPEENNPIIIKSISSEDVFIRGRILDIASGAKKISVSVCYYLSDCNDDLNFVLKDQMEALGEYYIDRWEFRLSSSFDTFSDASLKSGVNHIKLSTVDASGNSSELLIRFIIDNRPPEINSISFHALGDDSIFLNSTEDRVIGVKVNATDNETKIEKVCLKLDSMQPGITNNCWQELDVASSFVDKSFIAELGFFPKQYDVYVWAIDELGNISNTHYSSIFFTPSERPHLLEVFAANTSNLTYWPTVGEMTTSVNSDENKIIIKWRVPELERSTIDYVNLSYRIEDSSQQVYSIAKNVFPGVNPGGCSVGTSFQGCFVWTGPGIPGPDVKFSIHIDLVNLSGQTDGGNTNDFNSSTRDFSVFGNTKLGTHHLSVSDVFQTFGYPNYSTDNLIVFPDGTVYVVDEYRGLIRISANEGTSNIIISEVGSAVLSDNGWEINGKVNRIKVKDSYLYFRYLDSIAVERTGRAEIVNLITGELSNFISEYSLPVSSNEFWSEDNPTVPHPTSHFNCKYQLGLDNIYYCYDLDLSKFYKLVDGEWQTILMGDGNSGCPDGASALSCNDLSVSTFFVDELGVLYFTNSYQIRYLSPANKVYSIYGKKIDDPLQSYGEDIDLKAGRLVRIPKNQGTAFNLDWINSKINVNSYHTTQYIGTCSNDPCGNFSISDEGFNYSSRENNGFVEIIKTNNNLPPEKPVLSTNDGLENLGRFVVKKRSVSLNISSNDNNSNIDKICFKYNVDESASIALNDPCWKTIDGNDQTTLNLINYPYNLGFVAGDYDLYAWVMDDDQNISPPSDVLSFTYTPGKPPEVKSVLATNKNIPSAAPPNYTDLVINGDNRSLFIKWIATDFNDQTLSETLNGLIINIYYSLDNITFRPITSAQNLIPNISASNCTTNSPDEVLPGGVEWTGCFEWPVPNYLQGKMLFIRVEAIDEDSLGASAMAPPINAGNLSILAGDIDKGIGGQARSAMFSLPANDKSDRGGWAFPNSFVVDSQGVTYFLDVEMGIMMVDPSDGIIELLIEIDESFSIPPIGEQPVKLSNSKLKIPISIFLEFDENENILVYDRNFLRRIDVKNKSIQTVLGGGGGNGSSRKFNPENCDSSQVLSNGSNYSLMPSALIKELPVGFENIIIVDSDTTVPPIGEETDISEARLVNPVSIYAQGSYVYIQDSGFLRRLDTNSNKIKTIRVANTAINCGYSYSSDKFNFEFLNTYSRPNLNTNLRTIITLPRGDMLIDYHGISQKREGNWNSYFDNNVPGVYDVFPDVRSGRSAEIRSGLWWYRPVNFSDLNGEWGVYPIKFTDGDKGCVNHGFTASFNTDPLSIDYGKIQKIYAILLNECQIDDSDSLSNQKVLEFDPSPLYDEAVIPAPQNELGASILPWPRLMATATPPLFNNNGVNSHYNATSVGRDGVPLLFNRAKGMAYSFSSDPDSRVVKRVLGDGIGSTCVDGKAPFGDDCNIEILDLFKTADGTIYFWDLSQIKSISDNKIITVFGKPANHGNGYLSTSARFSYISDFGVFGRDPGGAPNSQNIMLMDVYSRTFRNIIDGKIDNHFGSGHYGLNSDSQVDGNNLNHKIYFDWGDDNPYVRKSFEVDADGNVYFVNRTRLSIGVWNFENNKISFDDFYLGLSGNPTSVRKLSPITHQTDSSLPITSFNKYLPGNIIGRATYRQDASAVSWSARVGHVLGVNQADNNLLLHMNSKNESVAGAMYVMNLDDTASSTYASDGDVKLFRSESFELPKVANVLANYNDPALPLCYSFNELQLDECKFSSLSGSDHGFSFYENGEGEKYWVSWFGANIFSMQEIPGAGYGSLNLLHQTSSAKIKSLDIDIINGERILAYCFDGEVKILNLETGIETKKEFKIKGMECSKGGIEIVYNQQTNKFALISAVTYKGLHAIVEIALPSSPRVTSVRTDSGSNVLTSKKFFMRISGKDPKEPLSQYCIKFNDSTTPESNDGCWSNFSISNVTEVNDYLVEAEIGSVEGEYKIFVWFKDVDGEISGISNDQVGTEGVDKISVVYEPPNETIIDNFIVTTSSGATSINFDNTRDSRDTIDRYYISWNLRKQEEEIEASLDLTFNGVDFYSIRKGLDPYSDFCSNGFSGCYTWLEVYNFIASFVPAYQQDQPFKIRLTISKPDGRKYSMMSSPIGGKAITIIGENYHGIGSSWEDFSFPLINQIYNQELHYHDLITQQFVVTQRGDILFNHPQFGIIILDIETGLTRVAIAKRFDDEIDSNGNGNRWPLSKVDVVSKISMDENNNIFIVDKNEIRKFSISNTSSSINTFQNFTNAAPENPFSDDKINAPFYISDGHGHFHKTPLKVGLSSADFSFSFLSNNHNNESVISTIRFDDFKDSIKTTYPDPIGEKQEFMLINDDNCGLQAEKSVIDVNTCSLKNYYSTGKEVNGLSDFYFIADCGCIDSGGAPNTSTGLFHLQPYWNSDSGNLEYRSDLNKVTKFIGSLSTDVISNGRYFNGLDKKLYLIYRGETSNTATEFDLTPSLTKNAGIWKFDSVAGWSRILGVDGSMGTCDEGDLAISCAASPRDMFVTKNGMIYFIENTHLKRIDEAGRVRFVTGRTEKLGTTTSPYVYRADALTDIFEIDGNRYFNGPILNKVIGISDGNVTISDVVSYSPYTNSATYHCNDQGFVCKTDIVTSGCEKKLNEQGDLVDNVVFPETTNYLYQTDVNKLGETNNSAYLSYWKCFGESVFEKNGEYFVPYFDYGSSGVMQLFLD